MSLREVPLGNTQKFGIIDDEDYCKVGIYKWYIAKSKAGLSYIRTTSRKKIYLHRLIMNAKKGEIIDHIDGNTLNCSRRNLRRVTYKQNAHNSCTSKRSATGIKGVSPCKFGKPYVAQIVVGGKMYRAWFNDIVDAAEQYKKWSEELHGEYGCIRPAKDVEEAWII